MNIRNSYDELVIDRANPLETFVRAAHKKSVRGAPGWFIGICQVSMIVQPLLVTASVASVCL